MLRWLPHRHRPRPIVALVSAVVFLTLILWYTPWPLGSSHLESVRLRKFMNSNAKFLSASQRTPVKKSSFDWGGVSLQHLPPAEQTSLPNGWAKSLPPVQHSFGPESQEAAEKRQTRRNQVRKVFEKDWQSYRARAWGKDALLPVTGGSQDQFSGWAATLVDSLDTLWIMGFREEFDEAVDRVAEMDFGQTTNNRVNMFETTIRYLGGLLAAYDLSERPALLAKAVELGDLIYAGFNTENLMPVDFIDFAAAKTGEALEVESWVVAASPGTLTLELTRLSQITGDGKYYDVVSRVMRLFHEQQQTTKIPGLWPMWISMSDQNLDGRNEFTLGGGSDSLFEYLPKAYALLGGLEPMYETMTARFIEAARDNLFFRPMLPTGEDVLISGTMNVDSSSSKGAAQNFIPESEHLTCFIGGTVALAGRLLGKPDHVEIGAKLARGCAYAYKSFASGIMPERYTMVPCEPRLSDTCAWDEQRWVNERNKHPEREDRVPLGFTTAKDHRYLLRPEAIESIFILYRITGDPSYQDTAWEMFQAILRSTNAKYGHAALHDVSILPDTEDKRLDNLMDYMESFWLAETLKYFYLIFSPPDMISLDEYVLNTEAHPLLRPR